MLHVNQHRLFESLYIELFIKKYKLTWTSYKTLIFSLLLPKKTCPVVVTCNIEHTIINIINLNHTTLIILYKSATIYSVCSVLLITALGIELVWQKDSNNYISPEPQSHKESACK